MKPTLVEQAKELGEYMVFMLQVFGFENYFINNQLVLIKVIAIELTFCCKYLGKKRKS